MFPRVLVLVVSALILAFGDASALAQEKMPQPVQQHTESQPRGPEGSGMTGHGGMMESGMMGGRMMGANMMDGRAMGPPMMLRMMFALIDTDSDGTIDLREFQAAHERIFKAMDTNKDGRLTLEEMQAFMRGTN